MADNVRPALYGTRYTALPVLNPNRQAILPAWIAGPYCESGDILIEDLLLPKIEPEELLAVPVSGAYQLSMSSNYNGAARPAVLWLEEKSCTLVISRQSANDLFLRDRPLP
jgi:diaminopimelate decarboxylase